ncbi:uncharacterized protein KGF55_003653 [Candida pseudojiufengensis]|uniref:uncharacterized protein n=1 Tax=Candida pseudojiufengensis TaxID=497109 RepID=UPI002224349F|nr:uncharacterized protein KGF55_003653 [Candida pseudojiufengensis]KAI5962577.1 hypothetical protein KGF55_003653 [Candida pseudojiufengensis]
MQNGKHETNNSNGLLTNLDSLVDQYQEQARYDDDLLKKYGEQVNQVFKNVKHLLISNDQSQIQIDLPYKSSVSSISLKILSTQLNKLRLLDTKLKNESIDIAKQKMEKKINKLELEKSKTENQISSIRLKLLKKESELFTNYENELLNLDKEIKDFENVKIAQVIKQSSKLQIDRFLVLIDSIIQKNDKKLLFYYQIVLKTQEYLGYNLVSINQFLERIIVFQCQLNSIFKMKLPYLSQLCKYLPDSKFYDLLKRKEMMMTGGYQQHHENNSSTSPNHTPNIDNFYEEDAKDTNDTPPKEINNATEKIIKLGEEYKLPLSSKTLNYQRRAARSSSVTSTTSTSASIEPAELNSIPIMRENTSPFSNNFKKITIPHKIINKPFNKLSIKDFFEFLVIIVKIIINFQQILKYFKVNTDDYSMEDWCDMEKLLSEISNQDQLNLRLNNDATLSNPKPSTSLPKKLNAKSNFQFLLEHVYKSIIMSPYAQKQQHHMNNNKLIGLQNLNFKNLFLNQISPNFNMGEDYDGLDNEFRNKDEWDLISEIL